MTAAMSRRSLASVRLALDHRGDDQDVVGRRGCAARARRMLTSAMLLAEGVELLGDERAARRARLELVGRREQEALEARGRCAARRSGAG